MTAIRRIIRSDGSAADVGDPDADLVASRLFATTGLAAAVNGSDFAAIVNEIRVAERMAALRIIHENNQYQDGGSHPNAWALDSCGECSRVLEELAA